MFGFFLVVLMAVPAAWSQRVVALDGFHNNESKMPDHYQWDGTRAGGYSELGKVLRRLGAELRTIRERVTSATLNGVGVFIIVDPDTPLETEDPKYLEPPEIEAIEQWVRAGGRLVLRGNDKGNAEFQHLNQLAKRFGIEFLEETYPKVKGKGILIAKGNHEIFEGGLEVYLVEVAPLKLARSSDVILSDHGTPIMALAHAGQGAVFALGRSVGIQRVHRSQRQSRGGVQSDSPSAEVSKACPDQRRHRPAAVPFSAASTMDTIEMEARA